MTGIIIDVSKWQGVIDWQKVRDHGVEGAIIKATGAEIGKHFTDSRFAQNCAGARAAGIRVGAYHFLNASMDGEAQCDYYVAAVEENGGFQTGDFLPVVDCEWPKEPGFTDTAHIAAFVDAIQRGMEINPMIYTGNWWWQPAQGDKAFAAECPLWLAAYTNTMPKPASPWSEVALWQYSDKGQISGIAGNVDMNKLIGPIEAILI